MPHYDIEIIQPLYNPPANWVAKYVQQQEELRQLFLNKKIKIYLVNDGSTQHVDEVAIKQLQEKVENIEIISYTKNKGKGFALRVGISHSTSSHILYTDYDFPYQTENLKQAYEKLEQGHDIVIGLRGDDYYEKLSFFRTFISKGFNFFTARILKIPYSDTQSGLKAFSLKGKKQLQQTRINRFLFDTELIYHAHRANDVKITTIPVKLHSQVVFTKINPRILFQELRNLFFIFKKR